ncbi:hypothetical protein GLOIN_2v1784920 [Rhizophagus irregularis DAOM 181602=DAOM 197198]|nr:hypothetical protein GLOIN_2v1784920 [Rhizophagus irregularis DAOM 181602=DAOM 197198]
MDKIEVETQNNTSASETKIDISDNMKEHGEEIEKTPSETKDDTFEKHRKSISQILVPLYINEEYGSDGYVVTYSSEDRSVLGWSVNIENNGPQQPDVYFKVDQIKLFSLQTLSKKILLLRSIEDNYWLVDLNGDRTSSDRFLKLKHQVYQKYNFSFGYTYIGSLPNGDLIQVSPGDHKIYKYHFTDKPKNTVPWEYSQIIDIEIPESLNGQVEGCSIYQTKLFLIVNGLQITMNKNQTLLATNVVAHIYSMENGMLIYKNEDNGYAVQFITLKNTERLFIYHEHSGGKLVDPYQVYDEIVISDGFNRKTSVITKLNRKIFIENGNVCITDGIDENKLQQLLNKTLYIYTLPIFKIIQSMLNEIIDQVDIKKVVPREEDEVEINENIRIKNYSSSKVNAIFFRHVGSIIVPYILSFKLLNNQDLVLINMKGIDIYTINEDGTRHRYFWNNNEWNDIYEKFREERGEIYDNNFTNEHYKPLIGRILKNEFDDSKHSIPLPKFTDEIFKKQIVEDVINDKFVSPKFEAEILKIAIKKKCNDTVRQIIESNQGYSENYMTVISLNLAELCDYYPDYIITYILRTSIMLSPYCNRIENSKNTSLHSHIYIYIKESNMNNIIFKFISKLYNGLIQYLRIKEEIQTVSFIVPFPQICVYQNNSENNDHENHKIENNNHENYDTKNNDDENHNSQNNDHENENNDHKNHDFKNNNYENCEAKKNHDIKSKMITLLKNIITGLKIIMMIPKSNSIWNEFLYKPKSILFCNLDSNNFYNWWNFAAIIDFKWKTFGRVYYYLIWLFYTIFYVCYSLASTLEQMFIPDFYFKLLFIISIIFGSIFLIFEIRCCLWNYKTYFNDVWNLFGK